MRYQTYNGYSNYQTWAVSMFLDGNYTGPGVYEGVLQLARDAVEDNDPYPLSKAIREYVNDIIAYDINLSGLASDLLGWAIKDVDWMELAQLKLQEVKEGS